MRKPTICLDFDGVIHWYRNGWKGAGVIDDEPVPGVKEAIEKLLEMGYQVAVYSSRCCSTTGHEAICNYLDKHGIRGVGVTRDKPPAALYVDDRAFRFDGDWTKLIKFASDRDNLEPWQSLPDSPRPTPTLADRLRASGLMASATEEVLEGLRHLDDVLDQH